MKTISMGRNEYRRLDFGTLNFANEEEIDKKKVKDVTPIRWSESVISGAKEMLTKGRLIHVSNWRYNISIQP